MIMNDVLLGQEFYHAKYDEVGVRVLTQTEHTVEPNGLIPYIPISGYFVKWAKPTDEVHA